MKWLDISTFTSKWNFLAVQLRRVQKFIQLQAPAINCKQLWATATNCKLL